MSENERQIVLDPYIFEGQLRMEIQQYAEGRKNDAARGLETPELAALLVEKFGYGLIRAAHVAGVDADALLKEVDTLVEGIDPDAKAHRKARWNARPAGIAR